MAALITKEHGKVSELEISKNGIICKVCEIMTQSHLRFEISVVQYWLVDL